MNLNSYRQRNINERRVSVRNNIMTALGVAFISLSFVIGSLILSRQESKIGPTVTSTPSVFPLP